MRVTAESVRVGACYRAKRPSVSGSVIAPVFNDRMVLWISANRQLIQYDSPAISNGRHYPKQSMVDFLKWAGREVTAEMPKDEWAPFSRELLAVERGVQRQAVSGAA